MERLSILDIYKIGVGPSSSHTLGPWKAAIDFTTLLSDMDVYALVSINVHLFGSLSKTGRGHGTDIAIILGLLGYDPVKIDTTRIDSIFAEVKAKQQISIRGRSIYFDVASNIVFESHIHPYHPNTLHIQAIMENGKVVEETYFSVGGGFIEAESRQLDLKVQPDLPYPIDTAKDLLTHTIENGMRICHVVRANEMAFQSGEKLVAQMHNIYDEMIQCVFRGCHTSGILPGGLHVTRRAASMADQLLRTDRAFENAHNWIEQISNQDARFNEVNRWVSCFALAVNEENAAFGRVVTSPTNGAAGVIPAVLLYYLCFCKKSNEDDIERFLLTSGEIGCLFKKGATISAAVGGCQAEIGVSSAMAAAGLTEVMGGTPKQVLMAAEIAMEHHLGMTCDPIGGLVQIPCIERNAMGAMKAITASNIALSSDADKAIVSLDDVIKTMWDTAQDMNLKYKETSEGGLAINLPVIQPSC